MSPDRIALYNYAHLPSLFKPQRRILDADLPNADTRLQILAMAIENSENTQNVLAGYIHSMDHYLKQEISSTWPAETSISK